MAELKTAVIPLTGKNYPTWKVQCKMALMKDSLWGIVTGSETLATGVNAETPKKVRSKEGSSVSDYRAGGGPIAPLHCWKSGGSRGRLEEARGSIPTEDLV